MIPDIRSIHFESRSSAETAAREGVARVRGCSSRVVQSCKFDP